MKRIANQFTYPTVIAVAAVLLAFMVLSSATPSLAASPKASKADRVEARIKELHTKLMITPEQEEAWNDVAQVMRDDSKTMEDAHQGKDGKRKYHDRYRRSQILWRNCRGTRKWHQELHPRSSSLFMRVCRMLRKRLPIRYSAVTAI